MSVLTAAGTTSSSSPLTVTPNWSRRRAEAACSGGTSIPRSPPIRREETTIGSGGGGRAPPSAGPGRTRPPANVSKRYRNLWAAVGTSAGERDRSNREDASVLSPNRLLVRRIETQLKLAASRTI